MEQEDTGENLSITGFLRDVKEPAATGAIIVVPLIVTFLIVTWLFGILARIPGTEMFELTSYFYLNQSIKLATFIVVGSVIITGVGKLADTRRGFMMEETLDYIFGRVPLIGSIYNAAKVTTDTVLGSGTDFGHPVKIELEGVQLTGFKTGNKTQEGRSIVFIPTSPNVTSGFVVEIDDEWLQPTDETVSEAVTKVLSAGFGMKLDPKTKVTENKQL